MLRRRVSPAFVACAVLAGLSTAPAAASAAPDQELPFTCAERWTGSSRAAHSPSSLAVDFNRDNDLGRLVVASASGVVSRVEDAGNTSYGRWVKIDHLGGYSTLYAHLKAQWVVPGQFVDQGAPIGRVGDTGGVTGAHLHYEQRLGRYVQRAVFHGVPFVYGSTAASRNCPDVPLAGDWNGDRSAEVAVFRRDTSGGLFELRSPNRGVVAVRLGRSTDLPVTGDWDGNGVTDVGVRRQATRTFILRVADGTLTRRRLGVVTDLPVTGDWDGNGRTDLGVWRPSALRFRLFRADASYETVVLGGRGSQPVTGDWDGDGATDVGVFDTVTATFSLRTVSAAGRVTVTPVPLGTSSDLPVTGDWNGDRVTDVGVWTPGTASFTLRVSPAVGLPTSTSAELRSLSFGVPR